jgi:hypothetical protein
MELRCLATCAVALLLGLQPISANLRNVYHPVGEKQATSTLVKCSLAGNSAQQLPNQGLAMPTKSHASQQRKAIAQAAIE